MKTVFCFLLSIITTICLSECSGISRVECIPVLPPYNMISLKPESRGLPGTYVSKGDNHIVEYFGLKIAVPKDWLAERIYRTIVRFSDLKFCQGFLLVYNKGTGLMGNAEVPRLRGCQNFVKNDAYRIKTDREYYQKLYSFTPDQLDPRPSYWQYWLLWSKSKAFTDADALYHYTGSALEAFQRNTSVYTRLHHEKGTRTELVIFPAKIAPDYLTLIAEDQGDAFFADFLDMLNTLNPR